MHTSPEGVAGGRAITAGWCIWRRRALQLCFLCLSMPHVCCGLTELVSCCVTLCLCQGQPNNITINYLCGYMSNASLGTPLERFVQLNKALFSGAPNNADFDGMITSMNATGWDSGTAKAGGGCGHGVVGLGDGGCGVSPPSPGLGTH